MLKKEARGDVHALLDVLLDSADSDGLSSGRIVLRLEVNERTTLEYQTIGTFEAGVEMATETGRIWRVEYGERTATIVDAETGEILRNGEMHDLDYGQHVEKFFDVDIKR